LWTWHGPGRGGAIGRSVIRLFDDGVPRWIENLANIGQDTGLEAFAGMKTGAGAAAAGIRVPAGCDHRAWLKP
jgi:hypothetical protein